jgi:hypothetical protein
METRMSCWVPLKRRKSHGGVAEVVVYVLVRFRGTAAVVMAMMAASFEKKNRMELSANCGPVYQTLRPRANHRRARFYIP